MRDDEQPQDGRHNARCLRARTLPHLCPISATPWTKLTHHRRRAALQSRDAFIETSIPGEVVRVPELLGDSVRSSGYPGAATQLLRPRRTRLFATLARAALRGAPRGPKDRGRGSNRDGNGAEPVKHVEVIQEREDSLAVVIGSCHFGCKDANVSAKPESRGNSCHVCGIQRPSYDETQSFQQALSAGGSAERTRRALETGLISKAVTDRVFRSGPISQPRLTYATEYAAVRDTSVDFFLRSITRVDAVIESEDEIFVVLAHPHHAIFENVCVSQLPA